MSYTTIIFIIIRIILSGIEPTEAVHQLASKHKLNPDKLWSLLPDIYK